MCVPPQNKNAAVYGVRSAMVECRRFSVIVATDRLNNPLNISGACCALYMQLGKHNYTKSIRCAPSFLALGIYGASRYSKKILSWSPTSSRNFATFSSKSPIIMSRSTNCTLIMSHLRCNSSHSASRSRSCSLKRSTSFRHSATKKSVTTQ